jgi:hypothetical protein
MFIRGMWEIEESLLVYLPPQFGTSQNLVRG